MDPARLRKIPVFSDLADDELRHVAARAGEEGTASVERGGERREHA